jgi:L-alanine-DL-glutamate epimerase-like enolase superfamily enzyme
MSESGVMKIPSGPGLGVKFNPGFVNKAVVVSV